MVVHNFTTEPVAIVGSSCRFPGGSSTPSKLWELLEKPRDVLKEIPASRFNVDGFYHEDVLISEKSTNVRHAYLLDEDHRVFDYNFFGISPREAETMDPQMRILLETVYEGIETAGYSLQSLRGSSTSVFVGMMNSDYMHQLYRDLDSLPQYAATGMTMSMMANRISYFFDWHGPSVAIDTACSSSMVGLHQAVQALRNGESKVAIAAGTNIILGPEVFVAESKLHMLSPNGRSYMWDARADGYTRGEGAASVVLKTLSQAIADGDSIECIIRETGINQDGRTPGITMPSAEAQASLIRSTYARCGLDLDKPRDRPHFFEAHGTGTPAGDPIEAEAIYRAFFPEGSSHESLAVGSIKSVVGHLEGTAGLAGLTKASLAIQQGVIPPNLHFQQLNKRIEPFYGDLYIPKIATPWPELPIGMPRRVSVNNFGFGGTNGHAILESWPHNLKPSALSEQSAPNECAYGGGPFLLSANSTAALMSMAKALSGYIKNHPDVDLTSLAYTLSHRSEFAFRASFSATSPAQLSSKLDNFQASNTRALSIPESLPIRILAVFTGQGAQWPTMGKALYRAAAFRSSIEEMQSALDSLPDGPSWSIIEALSEPPETSRIHQAAFSQPLCTAIQIGLVEMLRAAGISFSAVVGHSSGEIGAAYAAGYLGATDAIRIAYYRGVYAKLAQGPQGRRGKMMAVSMTMEQATEFCNSIDATVGTIGLAASNSRQSCTLAGDGNAIDEAKRLLDQQGTFARLLKVDTAYHSHHMEPCALPYLQALQRCNVQVQDGERQSAWYSSVYGLEGRWRGLDPAALAGQYWVDNMTKPVLFSQAVQRAISEEQLCFDLIMEIGPHPSLKGPTSEGVKAFTSTHMPYTGILERGVDASESLANALGFVWDRFLSPKPIFSIDGIRKSFLGNEASGGLEESRQSKQFRSRQNRINELLGHSCTNGEQARREMRWRQVLKVDEVPWTRGHSFQGQVLFPASGYLVMAHEAAMRLAEGHAVRLVELHDISIHRAMTLEENSSGTEVTFTIRTTSYSAARVTAEYACYSANVDAGEHDGSDQLNFNGKVDLLLGMPHADALPRRNEPKLPMDILDIDRFYSSLADIGLEYSGDFRAEVVQRRLNQSTVTVKRPETPSSSFRIHPGTLDAAVQGLFSSFAYPGDGRLWTAYLPTTIDRVRFNGAKSKQDMASARVVADTTLTHADARNIICDVDLFCAEDGHPEVQIRGLNLKTFANPQPQDDRRLYAHDEWVRDVAYGIEPSRRVKPAAETRALNEVYVRSAFYYLRRLHEQIKPEEVSGMAWNHQHLLKFVRESLLPRVETGEYPDVSKDWAADTVDMLAEWRARFPESIDLQLAQAVGENLPAIVRGTVPPLQVMMQDGMLDRIYTEGLGFRQANHDLAVLTSQLAKRYPKMKILEIGAGTGGATGNILPAMQGNFASYTYTDISPGFFDRAGQVFAEHADKMIFKTLNIEKDPFEQGFAGGSYDLIIASNVLHATRELEVTMRHCRRLLRPGGHIMLLEITREFLPAQLIMGTLPGWFLGIEDGRVWAPTITEEAWDGVLKKTGFSGLDTSAMSFFSVMVSQATDDTLASFRAPLAAPIVALPPIQDLVILGGASTESQVHVETIVGLLKSRVGTVMTLPDINYIKRHGIAIPYGSVILSLSDLDLAVFSGMDEERFEGLQEIARSNPKAMVWITVGATNGDDPIANMIVGWGRCIASECPETQVQLLDLGKREDFIPEMIVNTLLRLVYATSPGFESIAWTIEHEMKIMDGAVYFPRVTQIEPLNLRYNADRRNIIQVASLEDNKNTLEIIEDNGSIDLQQHPAEAKAPGLKVHVKISESSVFPLTTTDGQSAYLGIGSVAGSGNKVAVLSRTKVDCSVVDCLETDILPIPQMNAEIQNAGSLNLVILELLAQSILSTTKTSIWVHGATEGLAKAFQKASAMQDRDVFLTTSTVTSDPSVHYIHPFVSRQELAQIRPLNAQSFINLQWPMSQDLDRTIRSILPISTQVIKSPFDVSPKGLFLPYTKPELQDFLKHQLDRLQSSLTGVVAFVLKNSPLRLNIGDIQGQKVDDLHPATVIDWAVSGAPLAKVIPLQHNRLFSADKTYLLIGLSGDMGLSIAEWMIKHGARHIVVSSRNPKVPRSFIEHIERKGAELRVVALDVSDREALHRVYQDIRATMPRVGGVMNGAMVLRDRSFVNTPWADFAATLAPKVQGSAHLDELFRDDRDLEFMIFFSSLSSILGNAGQAAYASANLFMTGLARQRRRRGVAASVLHVGMVVGVGYVHRAESREQYEVQLKRNGCMPISETDLHGMLAEAIVRGRDAAADGSVDLITGLQKVDTAAWRDNPRFALDFCGQDSKGKDATHEDSQQRKQAQESVSSQLESSSNENEMAEIIQRGFLKTIGKILQIGDGQLDANVTPSSLGIDSLVAVQVRSWFLKEVGVDIPVLKVLGGNTIVQLCKDALAAKRRAQTQDQTQVGGGRDTSEEKAVLIDWESELSSLLDGVRKRISAGGTNGHTPSISPGANGDSYGASNGDSSGVRVVLTGATGFLGTGILRRLLAEGRVAEVHCIGIRPDKNGQPRRVKMRHAKISEYAGELTAPNLGLSEADFVRLSRRADVIIHNAAQVRFLQSYRTLRPANVDSTATLLAMAAPRHVPVHFVSTGAVSLFVPEADNQVAELPEISPASFPPPTDIDVENRTRMGYAASKWVSEMLLERAATNISIGVPAVVHRPVAVLGPDAPETDLMSAIERYSMRMCAVPALDAKLWPGYLDIVDVEDVARGIVADAVDELPAQGKFVVRNYCTEDRFTVEELQEFYTRKTGQEVAIWPLEKWLGQAASLGLNKHLALQSTPPGTINNITSPPQPNHQAKTSILPTMQFRSIIASLLLATVASASPVPTEPGSPGEVMATYCDATNLGGFLHYGGFFPSF
ncbi:ketoacyl-synt-domain-containing protein [Apiospora kogelbergensis]|uniref:ketoacyl-synt-domain-containing protein n=1 Tax=Apiospora kogelbergensis TaxID=1337665 RepID=UPI00313115E5